MGKWLEVIEEKYIDLVSDYDKRETHIIAEIDPTPLIAASYEMPREIKESFPFITRLDVNSSCWDGELQVFRSRESQALLDEVIKLRRICRGDIHHGGFDAAGYYERWRQWAVDDDFEGYLNRLENCLELASKEGFCSLIML